MIPETFPLFRNRISFVSLVLAAACLAFASARAAEASDDARALEIGRAYLRLQQQLRAAAGASESGRWWQQPVPQLSAEARDKIAAAHQTFHDAVRSLLRAEPVRFAGREPRFGFLPEDKQEAVARIEQKYTERINEFRREHGSTRLASDLPRLQQLNADRERELAAVLTAAEREMLDLRTSPSSTTVRQRYGPLIQSEEEYRKIYLLQKAFDEKFSNDEMMFSARPTDTFRLRSEAEHRLVADIGEVVGPERAVAFRRAIDQDYIAISGLVRRLNLPASAADEFMRIRENYATQSLTINAETGLNYSDRRALVQDLAKDATKDVIALLGKEGFEAYSPRSSWLRNLENGTAFSTDPKDARGTGSIASPTMGVYYVMPGGTTRVSSPSPSAPTVVPVTPPNPSSVSGGTENKAPAAKRPVPTPAIPAASPPVEAAKP